MVVEALETGEPRELRRQPAERPFLRMYHARPFDKVIGTER